jgi:hypothetical protein
VFINPHLYHSSDGSRRLPTATDRVRSQFRPCGICGGRSSNMIICLQVLPVMPVDIPVDIRGWYSGRNRSLRTKWAHSYLIQSSTCSYICIDLYRPCHKVRRLVSGFPPRRPGFEPGSGHVGFAVNKMALGQVFSEYFGFTCQSIHQLIHTHHPSSVVGAIGQIVAYVPSVLSLTLHPMN